MHTARIPPVDPAPATITAVLAMHAGHICPSFELLIRSRRLGVLAYSAGDQGCLIVDVHTVVLLVLYLHLSMKMDEATFASCVVLPYLLRKRD